VSLLTDARVFNKNQRRILLPGDASYRGLSNCRKTQFLVKVIQTVWYTTVSSMKLNALPFCKARLLTVHTFS